MRGWVRTLLCGIFVSAAALGLVACGSGGGAATSATTAAAAETGAMAKLYAGTFGTPPKSSPPPQAGKDIWLISCGQAAESCAAPIDATQKAAESIGWRARIIDTKFNPAVYGAAIRQAIAAGADGIVVYAGDCAFARPQLAEARQAGIPVVGVESVDCDESDKQEKPEFAATVEYEEGSFVDWTEAYARAQAAWAIAHTGGEAKVLMLENEQTLTLSLTTKAFAQAIEACSGCSIVGRVPFTLQDVGSALAEKTQQALLQAPEANVVYAINDTFVTGGVAQAVAGSGRDVAVVGGEGFEANADLVRESRGQSAGVGSATAWEGFAAVDTLNRLFDGKRPAPSGIGLQVYDADHNLPASGPWEPPVDFEAAYDRAWHVQ